PTPTGKLPTAIDGKPPGLNGLPLGPCASPTMRASDPAAEGVCGVHAGGVFVPDADVARASVAAARTATASVILSLCIMFSCSSPRSADVCPGALDGTRFQVPCMSASRVLWSPPDQLLVVWNNQIPLPPARAEETATTPASRSAASTRLRMVIPASF